MNDHLELLTHRRALLLASASLAGTGAAAQAPGSAAPAASAAPELPLFAVEIKTGPKWDAAKPPTEQAAFREHSARRR